MGSMKSQFDHAREFSQNEQSGLVFIIWARFSKQFRAHVGGTKMCFPQGIATLGPSICLVHIHHRICEEIANDRPNCDSKKSKKFRE